MTGAPSGKVGASKSGLDKCFEVTRQCTHCSHVFQTLRYDNSMNKEPDVTPEREYAQKALEGHKSVKKALKIFFAVIALFVLIAAGVVAWLLR